MKNISKFVLISLISIFLFLPSISCRSNEKIISIVKSGSYEGIDIAHNSLLDNLNKKIKDLDSYKIETQNADFNRAKARKIGEKLVKKKPKVVIALGDIASTEIASALGGSGIKMVYCAVNDKEKMQRWMNTTGSFSPVNFDAQFSMIKDFIPLYSISVGVVVSKDYHNSKKLFETMLDSASSHKIRINYRIAENEYEVVAKAKEIFEDIQFPVNCLLLLSDDIVNANALEIVELAQKYNIPVFASEAYQLSLGCLASVNQYFLQAGKVASDQVYEVFDNAYMLNVPKPNINTEKKYYNKDVLEKYKNKGIKLPDDISQYNVFEENKD